MDASLQDCVHSNGVELPISSFGNLYLLQYLSIRNQIKKYLYIYIWHLAHRFNCRVYKYLRKLSAASKVDNAGGEALENEFVRCCSPEPTTSSNGNI